jgi:hypothetical protein
MATATATRFDPRTVSPEGPQWFVGLLWLALLGPFFFLSYGFANWVASHRAYVPSVVFGWELRTPFLPWTIVPYWTSDLLYVVSLMVCTSRWEVNMQAKRLLAAQLISVACFLVFPLHCVFERPETHGFFGWLFTVLLGFDKPYNQAPSLHVSLAVILWSRFAAHLNGFWRNAMTAWLVLIVLSTMTTYQHQFLDLPTGALAGLLAIALFPDREGELRLTAQRRLQRTRLAIFYLSGSVLATAAAFKLEGFGWIFLWPAAAVLVVAIAYAADRPGIFLHPVIRVITAPYIVAAWLNSRLWTATDAPAQEIVDGVWLGRAPGWFGKQAAKFASVVSLAPELPVRGHEVPMLDLVTPNEYQLWEAAAVIEALREHRPTLVSCALGYSRSALTVAAWMVSTGRATSLQHAIALVRRRRPRVVVHGVEPESDEAGVAYRV